MSAPNNSPPPPPLHSWNPFRRKKNSSPESVITVSSGSSSEEEAQRAQDEAKASVQATALAQAQALLAQSKAQLRAQGATEAEIAEWLLIREKYLQLVNSAIQATFVNNSTQCVLAEGLTRHDRTNQYRIVPLGRRHRKIAAHVAAWMIHNIQVKPNDPMQVSHLCHHGQCIYPPHLFLETAVVNRARNMCIGWKWVTCPGTPGAVCGHSFNPCPHVPQCVLPQQ